MIEKDILHKKNKIVFIDIEKIPYITIIAFITIAITITLQHINFFEISFFKKTILSLFFYFFSYKTMKKNYIKAFFIVFLCYCHYSYFFVYRFESIKHISNAKKIRGIITNKVKSKNRYIYEMKVTNIDTKKENILYNSYVKIISFKNLNITDYVTCKNLYPLTTTKTTHEWKKNTYNQGYSAFFVTNTIKKYKEKIYYQKIYQFIQFIQSIKEYILRQCDLLLSDQPLFKTIFLGESNKNEEIKKIFNAWGIGHYLARSGIHIQILIAFMNFILLFLGLGYEIIIYLELIILIMFYFFSFQSISFLRAIMMFFITKFCLLLKIKTTSLHVISLTALLFFIFNPYCFFSLSTQLTFFCTFILTIINYKKHQI